MTHSTTPEVRKARKQYKCSWCGEHIEPGEYYTHWMYFGGYDTGAVNMHPECEAAFYENGEDEFCPGENPRGCNCGFSASCDRAECVARRAAEDEPGEGS